MRLGVGMSVTVQFLVTPKKVSKSDKNGLLPFTIIERKTRSWYLWAKNVAHFYFRINIHKQKQKLKI